MVVSLPQDCRSLDELQWDSAGPTEVYLSLIGVNILCLTQRMHISKLIYMCVCVCTYVISVS